MISKCSDYLRTKCFKYCSQSVRFSPLLWYSPSVVLIRKVSSH